MVDRDRATSRILLVIAALAGAFLSGRYWFPSAASVTAYLEDNPELLVDRPELIDRARPVAVKRAREQQRQERRDRVAKSWAGFLYAESTPRLGVVADPLVVVEFSGFACIPCKKSADRVAFLASSNPDTQIVQIYVPIGGEGAELAARVAIAVWQHFPERFSEVHHDLMATPVAQLDERARFWLERTEFSATNLWKAIGSESVLDTLQEGRSMFEELSVKVIPSFLIDGRLLAGPVATTEIQNVIDQARSAAGR